MKTFFIKANVLTHIAIHYTTGDIFMGKTNHNHGVTNF